MGIDSSFGNDCFANLHHADGFADLVVLRLLQGCQSALFSLLSQIPQQLFVLYFVLKAKCFSHGFVLREEELFCGDVFVSFLESELKPPEIGNGFLPQFLYALKLGGRFPFLLVGMILIEKLVVVLDFQAQETLLLGFKDLVGFAVIKQLLVDDQL